MGFIKWILAVMLIAGSTAILYNFVSKEIAYGWLIFLVFLFIVFLIVKYLKGRRGGIGGGDEGGNSYFDGLFTDCMIGVPANGMSMHLVYHAYTNRK